MKVHIFVNSCWVLFCELQSSICDGTIKSFSYRRTLFVKQKGVGGPLKSFYTGSILLLCLDISSITLKHDFIIEIVAHQTLV